MVKWFQYSSIVSSYRYRSLLDLFQDDLNLTSLDAIEQDEYKLCLKSFSWYCSYIYHNERVGLNSTLKEALGDEIQLDIHTARNRSFSDDSLLSGGIYRGLFCVREHG